MPLGCVILEGGGNAELRAWKAFGQWVNTIRKATPKPVTREHALYAARKMVIFIQGGDTLSKKVMEDLSPELRESVVDEGSSIVLSLLKRECVSAPCQVLSQRVQKRRRIFSFFFIHMRRRAHTRLKALLTIAASRGVVERVRSMCIQLSLISSAGHSLHQPISLFPVFSKNPSVFSHFF